jgi:hypothetical protein
MVAVAVTRKPASQHAVEASFREHVGDDARALVAEVRGGLPC